MTSPMMSFVTVTKGPDAMAGSIFIRLNSIGSSVPAMAAVRIVPMMEQPPIDAVTRVSKTLVEIGKADGL